MRRLSRPRTAAAARRARWRGHHRRPAPRSDDAARGLHRRPRHRLRPGPGVRAGSDSAALAIAGAKRANLNAHAAAPGNCQSLIANDAGQALAIATEAGRRQPALRPQGDDRAGRRAGDAHLRRHHGRSDANGILRVRVTVQRDVPTTLGRLAGVDSVKASRHASAGLGVAGRRGRLPARHLRRPGQGDHVPRDLLAVPDRGHRRRQGVEGRLLVEEAAPATGAGSSAAATVRPTLADAILHGCDIDLTLTGTPPTITVDGTPGNKINAGPVRDALDTVKGGTFAFPVYDKITGKGAGTEYRVVGFINLKFVDYDKRAGTSPSSTSATARSGRSTRPAASVARPALPSTRTSSASAADPDALASSAETVAPVTVSALKRSRRAAAPSAGRRRPGRRAARRRPSRAPRW